MEHLSTMATLVEPSELAGHGTVTAVLSRGEIERSLEEDGEELALWLDLERGDEHARVTLELTAAEAEELLRRSSDEEVTVALGASELARLLDEPDVEAHGIRERIVLLGVVAATAAAGTSVAQAKPILDVGAGPAAAPALVAGAAAAAGGEAPAAVTDGAGTAAASAAASLEPPAVTTGGAGIAPAAAPDAFERAAASQAPVLGGAVAAAGTESPAEATGGAGPIPAPVTSEGSGIELNLPTAAEGALLGGLALLVTGAGVAAARGSRRRPAMP